MSRKKRTLLILLVALLGVGLFAYPIVSNYLFVRNASTVAEDYDRAVENAGEEALVGALEEALIYNENLEGDPAHDPFLKGSGMVLGENYKTILDLDDSGAMGYLTIPKIGVKLSIYHGTAESTLQRGIGHLEGSSLPVGGPGTHCVVTGHTGLAHAKMFTDLIKLGEGDLFYLHVLGETLAYRVDKIRKVEPENIEDLRRFPGEDYCTLVTCTPYGVNSHRLLVRGARTEYIPEEHEQAIRESRPAAVQWWYGGKTLAIGLAAGVAAALAILLVMILKKRREKRWAENRLSRQNRQKRYWWEEEGGQNRSPS